MNRRDTLKRMTEFDPALVPFPPDPLPNRYKVTTVHGEQGTVYHVVDTQAPEDQQPAIVSSFSTGAYASRAHKCACFCRDTLNRS